MNIIEDLKKAEQLDYIYEAEPEYMTFDASKIKVEKGDEFWSNNSWVKSSIVNSFSGSSLPYRRRVKREKL